MTRREFVGGALTAATTLAATGHAAARTQGGYTNGIFAGTPRGPVELLAYADRISNGQLRMSYGSFEDVPAFDSVPRILCNLPNWRPALVWLSTKRIFKDEYAERRNLPFAVRQINISAIEVRIADMEDPARVKKLVDAVRASADNPPYLFITLSTGNVTRDYIVELRIAEPQIV